MVFVLGSHHRCCCCKAAVDSAQVLEMCAAAAAQEDNVILSSQVVVLLLLLVPSPPLLSLARTRNHNQSENRSLSRHTLCECHSPAQSASFLVFLSCGAFHGKIFIPNRNVARSRAKRTSSPDLIEKSSCVCPQRIAATCPPSLYQRLSPLSD